MKWLNDLRKNWIRKGLVLIVCEDINHSKEEHNKLVDYLNKNEIRNKTRWYDFYRDKQIEINGYKIRFISKQYFSQLNNIRGTRPEILYLNCCTYFEHSIIDSMRYLRPILYNFSSRINFIRDYSIESLKDILTDDYNVKEYINIKSKTYKENRNKWIKNKLKYIITFGGRIK